MTDRRTGSRLLRRLARPGAFAAGLALAALAGVWGCGRSPAEDALPALVAETYPQATDLENVGETELGPGGVALRRIIGPTGTLGYVGSRRCQAKSGSFLLHVAMDPGLVVQGVDVSEYNASRGVEIVSPAFRRQFEGSSPADPPRLGEEVDAISGATVSSQAMTRSVQVILNTARRHVSR